MLNGITFGHWVYVKGAAALALLAIAGLSGCGTYREPPKSASTTPPTVTYNYNGEAELVTANRRASGHCDRYGGVPRAHSVANNTDGTRSIVFECVARSDAAKRKAKPGAEG